MYKISNLSAQVDAGGQVELLSAGHKLDLADKHAACEIINEALKRLALVDYMCDDSDEDFGL